MQQQNSLERDAADVRRTCFETAQRDSPISRLMAADAKSRDATKHSARTYAGVVLKNDRLHKACLIVFLILGQWTSAPTMGSVFRLVLLVR